MTAVNSTRQEDFSSRAIDANEYRVKLTTSCRDSDAIPKVANAGQTITRNGAKLQILHNGLQVLYGGYHGDWMAKIIESLKGHHEPQEEVVFDAILKRLGPKSSMIELGCFWSYYSLWFLQGFPLRRAMGVEPDPLHIQIGLQNAKLNGLNLEIRHGYIGQEPVQETLFETESSGFIKVSAISPSALVREFTNDGMLDILHCDTQGAEIFTLLDCEDLFKKKKIRFAFISTHAMQITGSALTHQTCLQLVKDFGGQIVVEHDVHESYSGDGLIVAYFGDEELGFPKINISRNRYSDSLFPNPIFELEKYLKSEADMARDNSSREPSLEEHVGPVPFPSSDVKIEKRKVLSSYRRNLRAAKEKSFSIPVLGHLIHFVDALLRLPRNDLNIKKLRTEIEDLKVRAQLKMSMKSEPLQPLSPQLNEEQTISSARPVGIPALNQISALELNLKQYGLTLGQEFADKVATVQCSEPDKESLGWRVSTQTDLESDWFIWWCQELKLAPIAHRKLWEYAWILQELHAANLLDNGGRGVGFGCGEEPLPSYLAARGLELLVTDLAPDREESKVWREAGQHGTSLASMFDEKIISRKLFESRVSHRYVDMNDIASDIRGYDFCWSVCALEHLGTIEAGLKFIENSISTLRPGGLALHTTEFNYMSDGQTVEEGGTVLFRRSDFEELAERLLARGCKIKSISFDVGDKPIDRYIDIPPYHLHEAVRMPVFETLQSVYPEQLRRAFASPPSHLKLIVEQFPTTCFGIVVQAPE